MMLVIVVSPAPATVRRIGGAAMVPVLLRVSVPLSERTVLAAQRDQTGVVVVAGNVPSRTVAGDARAAEGQGLGCRRDAALNLQGGAGGDGGTGDRAA